MQLISDQSLALIIDDQIRLLPSIADGELMMRNTGILIQGLRILDSHAHHPAIHQRTGNVRILPSISTLELWNIWKNAPSVAGKMTPFAVASNLRPPSDYPLWNREQHPAYFKQPWILFMPATKPSW